MLPASDFLHVMLPSSEFSDWKVSVPQEIVWHLPPNLNCSPLHPDQTGGGFGFAPAAGAAVEITAKDATASTDMRPTQSVLFFIALLLQWKVSTRARPTSPSLPARHRTCRRHCGAASASLAPLRLPAASPPTPQSLPKLRSPGSLFDLASRRAR